METKIAVLYFGQLRIKNGFTCPLNAMKTQLGQQPFDVYIHCWFDPDQRTYDVSSWSLCCETGEVDNDIINFVLRYYKPVKMLVQKSQQFDKSYFHDETLCVSPEKGCIWGNTEISNMISQIYSIQEVCKLVDPKKYDMFVLVRFDYVPVNIPTNCIGLAQSDFIQIFDKTILNLYCQLLHNTKHTVFDWVNAERLRSDIITKSGLSFQIDALDGYLVRNNWIYPEIDWLATNCRMNLWIAFISKHGLMIRQKCECSYHFEVTKIITSKSLYNWIGKKYAIGNQHIKFSINFHDVIPKDTNVGSKQHYPNTIINDWMNDIVEINKWYDVEFDVVLTDDLFIFLILDNYVGQVTFEIKIYV